MVMREKLRQNVVVTSYNYTPLEESAIYHEARARALAYRRRHPDTNLSKMERRLEDVLKQQVSGELIQSKISPFLSEMVNRFTAVRAMSPQQQAAAMKKYVDEKVRDLINASKDVGNSKIRYTNLDWTKLKSAQR